MVGTYSNSLYILKFQKIKFFTANPLRAIVLKITVKLSNTIPRITLFNAYSYFVFRKRQDPVNCFSDAVSDCHPLSVILYIIYAPVQFRLSLSRIHTNRGNIMCKTGSVYAYNEYTYIVSHTYLYVYIVYYIHQQ